MRTDPAGSQLTSRKREPRIAVGIIYPTGSIYITNKGALSNVPGNVVHGALEDISSVGRDLSPLDARSTIASFSFSVVDVDGELTDELRAQLVAGEGVGRRDVRVYTGDTDDFTDGTWSLVDTFVIDSVVQYDRGSYRFSCLDRQRQLREKIFPAVSTRLTADLGVGDTTVTVSNTDGFDLVPHTASFSDAPSTSVLYFRIKKTGEIIRATGKTSTTFTGCTRERFNTIAQAVDLDPSADVDKQPEVELIYYLEMPAPQLAYALMTGDILGTANSLPDGYHVGIDPAFVDDDLFTNIGADLYNPSDVTKGLVLSFGTHRGLRETDGKRFIEEQVLFPMWTFLPVSNEGKFGLRRLVRLLADAAPVALVDEDTIMSHGSLDHQVGEVANRVVINWNHDGERFTRQNIFTNAGSISAHGVGKTLEFDLLGVTVARHTRETVRRIFDAMTDRHGAPSQTMELELSATLNQLEVGDVIRTTLAGVRDYAAAGSLDRSFEVQSKSWNPRTGEVRVQGFASTARVEPDEQDPGPAPPLADAWYSSEGTALNTVLTMVGNAVTVSGNLPAGIYYHLNDLTINAGVTVTVNGNVHLRVRGAPTINGKIDGKGRGLPALVETSVVGNDPVPFGENNAQTFGATRSSGGINYNSNFGQYRPADGRFNIGAPAIARPALIVESGALLGMPTELRGTPGVPGGLVVNIVGWDVLVVGAPGGASGAGLSIVCRDVLTFGASGEIDLSGANGTAPGATTSVGGHNVYAGAGAGGAPGTLLVVLDGNDIPLPDLTDAFVAVMGATPQTGNRIEDELGIDLPSDPLTGFDPGLSQLDLWQSAHIAMWVPQDIETGDGDDEIVPAPTALAASVASDVGVILTWTSPPADKHDFIEVWRATTNDRTGAVRVFRGRADSYFETSATAVTRYFWIRAGREALGYSDWQPTGSTNGVSARYGGVLALEQWTPNLVNVTRDGQAFTKTGGSNGTFDASVYSSEGYSRCAITFKASQTNNTIDVGFDTNPSAAHDRNSIEYSIIAGSDGHVYTWDSVGGAVDSGLTYTTSDLFALVYDGTFMRWYKNGTLLRTTPVASANAVYFLDSSFYETGAAINELRFGPGTNVGTGNIDPESATVLVSSQPADATQVLPSISYSGGGTLIDYSVITSATWVNDTGEAIDVALRQSARVQLAASDSLIGRKLAMRWTLNGGGSYSYDGTSTDNLNITAADFQAKSTQRTVTVGVGETITVQSIIVLVIPDPTSGDPADVQYRGLSLSIEAILR